MKVGSYFMLLAVAALLWNCQTNGRDKTEQAASRPVQTAAQPAADPGLSDYWHQGEAEISRYELSQNRYRDVHPGEAILVFVTEDFLTDKQVKNERYVNPNSTPVLKTNYLKRFTTGIYDYSLMTSVFTPTQVEDFPHTLKVSTTAQDWCGHAYMQVNKEKGNYRMQLHSYFENEADQKKQAPVAMLEDEIFNRIRMHPAGLPTGEIKLLPSTTYCRLMHKAFRPRRAIAETETYLGNEFPGDTLDLYRIEYPELKRTLEFVYERKAPHRIAGWKETYPSLDGKLRTTLARRSGIVKSPYWEQNALQDTSLRADLEVQGL